MPKNTQDENSRETQVDGSPIALWDRNPGLAMVILSLPLTLLGVVIGFMIGVVSADTVRVLLE